MEVLGLLAKHELRGTLEQTVGRATEDEHVPSTSRPRQQQRRLAPGHVDELVTRYRSGESIDGLARTYRVNRTTVISHLERRGVQRRKVVRKMTDDAVAKAAARYAEGLSLVAVANEVGVCDRTLRREFRQAGVPVRARRGWQ